MSPLQDDENLAYHAARLLILISLCGKPRSRPAIKGRTLLAKLDFFLRYPEYLRQAAVLSGKRGALEDIGVESAQELKSVESRMVRYRYGPWDHIYYPALAYLLGKGLIQVETSTRTELFSLTTEGAVVAKRLATAPENADLAARALLVYSLFNRLGGTALKNYIYQHFPDVVGLNLNERI